MSKLCWLCGALVACANTGGSTDAARRARTTPSATAAWVVPAPSSVSEISAAAAATPHPSPVVIMAGGDVSVAREVGQRLIKDRDYHPLAGIDALWRDADVRFVNLESQLSFQNGETQSPRHRLIFTGPPEGADALARARVTLVSTANNHAWDYGRPALLETLSNLKRVGVEAVGTGSDQADATRVVTLDVRGTRIAWVAVTHVWNQGPIELHEGREHVAWAKLSTLVPIITRARREHDFVVLSYHGGAEYQDAPAEPSKRFLEAAIDAGVDVVVGHHPHVIQGVGFQQGRPIFFSLGNLLFGPRPEHPWTRYGMLAKVTLASGAEPATAVCPYVIAEFTPKPLSDPGDEANRTRFLAHLRSASTAVGGLRYGDVDATGCVEVRPPLTKPRVGPPRAGQEVPRLARR